MNEVIEQPNIEEMIYEIRGVPVMLDYDLASLYQCANGTKSINLSVKRNIERFPKDFYFQLTEEELIDLKLQFTSASNFASRFQIETLKDKRGTNMKYFN
jgi:hypothetical protein